MNLIFVFCILIFGIINSNCFVSQKTAQEIRKKSDSNTRVQTIDLLKVKKYNSHADSLDSKRRLDSLIQISIKKTIKFMKKKKYI